MRRLLRLAFLGALGALALGLLLVAGSSLAASGLYSAEEPWIGLGLDLLTIGLGLTALLGVIVVAAASQLGRLRLLLIPAVLVLAFWWSYLLSLIASGTQQTFRGPRTYDIPTEIYSRPDESIVLLGLPTLAIVLLAFLAIRPTRSESTTPHAAPHMPQAAPGGPP
jgi:hypothetical protein